MGKFSLLSVKLISQSCFGVAWMRSSCLSEFCSRTCCLQASSWEEDCKKLLHVNSDVKMEEIFGWGFQRSAEYG